MKALKFTIVTLYCAFVLISCEKYDSFNSDQSDQIKVRTSFSSVAPQIVSGRAVFTDLSHAIDYYDFLQSEIVQSPNQDSVLAYYESSLGYTSLRSISYVDEIDRQDSVKMLTTQFCASPMLLSILNQYNELKIGNDVYVYYSENQTYRIKDSDSQAISNFRGLVKNQDTIPYSAFTRNVWASDGDKIIIKRTEDSILIRTGADLTFYGEHPDPCHPWNYVLHGILRLPSSSPNLKIKFYINNVLIYEESTTNNSYFEVNLEVNSPNPFFGHRDYKAVAEWEDPITHATKTLEEQFSVEIEMECTKREEREPGWMEHYPDYAMSGLVFFKRELGRSHFGAWTYSWVWNSTHAKWKKVKAANKVEIEGVFRHKDTCAEITSKAEDDYCPNCKEIKASVGNGDSATGSRAWSDEEVFSYHRGTKGIYTFELNLQLFQCQ